MAWVVILFLLREEYFSLRVLTIQEKKGSVDHWVWAECEVCKV